MIKLRISLTLLRDTFLLYHYFLKKPLQISTIVMPYFPNKSLWNIPKPSDTVSYQMYCRICTLSNFSVFFITQMGNPGVRPAVRHCISVRAVTAPLRSRLCFEEDPYKAPSNGDWVNLRKFVAILKFGR